MKKILKIIISVIVILVLLAILNYVILEPSKHLDFLTFASIKSETVSSTGLTVSITDFNIHAINVPDDSQEPSIPDNYPQSSTLDFTIWEPIEDKTLTPAQIYVLYNSRDADWKPLKTTKEYSEKAPQIKTLGGHLMRKIFHEEYNINFEFKYGKLAPGHYKLVFASHYEFEFDVK